MLARDAEVREEAAVAVAAVLRWRDDTREGI
jgi:hypothetical protein